MKLKTKTYTVTKSLCLVCNEELEWLNSSICSNKVNVEYYCKKCEANVNTNNGKVTGWNVK